MKVASEDSLKRSPTKLKQWEKLDDTSKYNLPFSRDDNFQGPTEQRRCTDVPCLLFFAVCSLIAFGLACYGIRHLGFAAGDPLRLVYGSDYRGQVCGTGDLKAYEYTYLLQPDSSPAATCLDGCPIVSSSSAVCLYDSSHQVEILASPCYDAYLAKGYYNHYCLPADPVLREEVLQSLGTTEFLVTRLLGDIVRGWDTLAMSLLVAVGVGLLAIILMKVAQIRKGVALITVPGCLALMLAFGFFVYEEGVRIEEHLCADFGPVVMSECKSDARFQYTVASLALLVPFSLFVATTAYQIPKVNRGELALQLGIMPISSLWRLLFVPLLGVFSCACVLTLTLMSTLYLSSIAHTSQAFDYILLGNLRLELHFGTVERISVLFILLMGLWWTSVVAFTAEFMAASMSESWYFAKDRAVVLEGFRTAAKHATLQIGSIIYAAAVLPVLSLPRNSLAFLKSLVKKFSYNRAKCYLKSCNFCLVLYEKALKYRVVNSVAYEAMWGDSYSASSFKAFYLVKRSDSQPQNLLQACYFSLWLFELCVLLSAPVFACYSFLHLSHTYSGDRTKFVTSTVWVAFIAAFVSRAVAGVLRGFLRGCIHGVLIGYLCEQEMFPGLQRMENRSIVNIIEDISFGLSQVMAEESLKPTGVEFKNYPKAKSGRPTSRSKVLNAAKEIEKDPEILDMADIGRETTDFFNQTDTSFQPDSSPYLDTQEKPSDSEDIRPWTPELKMKPHVIDRNDPDSAGSSIPIDDSRPFSKGSSEKSEPEYKPYRLLDVIKKPIEAKSLEKQRKSPARRKAVPAAKQVSAVSPALEVNQSQKLDLSPEAKEDFHIGLMPISELPEIHSELGKTPEIHSETTQKRNSIVANREKPQIAVETKPDWSAPIEEVKEESVPKPVSEEQKTANFERFSPIKKPEKVKTQSQGSKPAKRKRVL